MNPQDQELADLKAAVASARAASDQAAAELARAQQEQASPALLARFQRDAAAAREREARLEASFKATRDRHPAVAYAKIQEEADNIQAPELSTFDWIRQNPSLLEAVPKTDDQRRDSARVQFVLDRVRQESGRMGADDPMSWSKYQGPLREDMDRDLAYAADPKLARGLQSPYLYDPPTWTDDSGEMLPLMPDPVYPEPLSPVTGSPLIDRTIENLASRPMGALFGGISRFPDNLIAAGRAAAEGRLTDAAAAAASAIPNLVSPAFHYGGAGMEDDWRPAAGPTASAAIDMAAFLAPMAARGPRIGMPQVRPQVNPALLRAAQRAAARRFHPDIGGDAELMRAANIYAEEGNLAALQGLLRQ